MTNPLPEISIEEYFKYHLPCSDERVTAHNVINGHALEFAKAIDSSVIDPECKKMAMFAVRQAQMFTNQGITVDELRSKMALPPNSNT